MSTDGSVSDSCRVAPLSNSAHIRASDTAFSGYDLVLEVLVLLLFDMFDVFEVFSVLFWCAEMTE